MIQSAQMIGETEALTRREQDYFASHGVKSLLDENGQHLPDKIDSDERRANPEKYEAELGQKLRRIEKLEHEDLPKNSDLSSKPQQESSEQENFTLTDEARRSTRTVPHGALHAEREEHKKTRAALAQLREQYEQMMEKFPSNNEISDETKNDNMLLHPQDKPHQEKHQPVEQEVWEIWDRCYQESKAELPDLDSAFAFLVQTRERQLSALGKVDERFQNEQHRLQQMHNELRDLVSMSLAREENPAKFIYDLAWQYGYGATEQDDRFRKLDKAQKAAKTLAATHGRDVGEPILMDTLANLSDADFAKWYEHNRDSFRKMFGG